MTTRPQSDPSSVTALVLQGGGALGAYQGGAYEALAAAGRAPDWVAGISIGAINAALIAGNPPARRVARLREFWQRVTADMPVTAWAGPEGPWRVLANDGAASWAAVFGVPGFFTPRAGYGWWSTGPTGPGMYDTTPLRETLAELVDFKRINDGPMRLSLGAVDIESGNFVYFDSTRQPKGPEHVMASGALPPGFPPVVVDGRAYWDGGLVSNTPLRHVAENLDGRPTTIFQIDLFSARGRLPATVPEAVDREKDIRYSSRTRALTDMLRERHELRAALKALTGLLPAEQRADPRVLALLTRLGADAPDPTVTLVHVIHRHLRTETQARDYEFSRASMLDHWADGLQDMSASLAVLGRATDEVEPGSFRVFDQAAVSGSASVPIRSRSDGSATVLASPAAAGASDGPDGSSGPSASASTH